MSAGDGRRPDGSRDSDDETSLLARLRTAEEGWPVVVRELLTSAGTVVLVAAVLVAVSGVWPPMVAIESESMEPHMYKGDLIFVTEPGRFVPASADARGGVVTYRRARTSGYRSLGSYGSVVVFDSPDRPGPPVIHRARFHVDAGENWYSRANESYVRADSCAELLHCPAPHAGFVTKGDNNARYDQANGISPPVKDGWVRGVGRLRIPYLGWIRLGLSGVAS